MFPLKIKKNSIRKKNKPITDQKSDIKILNKNSIENDFDKKFQMIYFDPPFNSDRNYVLNEDSSIGFGDKWNDKDYYNFIEKNVDKLYDLLKSNGTLFFHISSHCMYVPEFILRKKFKFL